MRQYRWFLQIISIALAFEKLPSEILREILGYSRLIDIWRLKLVSRLLNAETTNFLEDHFKDDDKGYDLKVVYRSYLDCDSQVDMEACKQSFARSPLVNSPLIDGQLKSPDRSCSYQMPSLRLFLGRAQIWRPLLGFERPE
jgi:hypothetical protein